MDEESTAIEALQQALKQEFNGDAGASEQDGHTQSTVTLVPKAAQPKEGADEKDSALTNKEAKAKRLSDAEWQEAQEARKTADTAVLKLERLKQALDDAPEEVRQEEDLAAQVRKLTELNERKEWEADHPIVRRENYREDWTRVNSDPRLSNLTYDEKWALISKGPSRVKEEYEAQLSTPVISQPSASKGTIRVSEANSLTMDILRKAGYSEQDMIDNGLRL